MTPLNHLLLQFQNAEEKQDDIISKLVIEMGQLCPKCSVNEQNFIEPEFSCPDNVDKQYVLFRVAFIDGGVPEENCDNTLTVITEWVQGGGASLLVLTNRLNINSSCDVQISVLSSPLQCQPSGDNIGANTQENNSNTALYAGAGGGVAVVVIIVFVFVLAMVYCLRRRKKKTR